MPSDAPDQRQTVHRLHPTSLIFSFLGHVRRYLVPLIVVLFLASKDRWELWFGLAVIPAMLYEVYRYISLRYRFASDELVITDGVIWRNERHIPFARIQNIDHSQGVLQRMLGVAEVSIETAGGAEPEAVLRVLAMPLVDDMRRRVFGLAEAGPRADGESMPEAGDEETTGSRELLRLGAGDLARLGLNPGRGIGIVFVLAGLAWEYEILEGLDVSESLGSTLSESSIGIAIALGLGLALVLLVALLLLSAAWHVVRFFDFRLQRQAGGFRIESGLLTRRTATVPRERIQFLTVSESVLHRCMGRVTVKIETAGGTEKTPESRDWFAPIVRKRDLPRLLRAVHPDLALDGDVVTGADRPGRWRPLAPGARGRMLRRALIVSVGLAAACALAFRPWGGLALAAILPVALWRASVEAGFIGYARTPYGVLFRSGAWHRKWGVTFDEKIQVVTWNANPFDRRHGMATLKVDTAAGGRSGQRIHVPYLPRETARSLQQELVGAAAHAEFRWSS
ncbi:MAG: PH domain-containing protein [Planctomycetota bacterium]|jgi:putative membrane protein